MAMRRPCAHAWKGVGVWCCDMCVVCVVCVVMIRCVMVPVWSVMFWYVMVRVLVLVLVIDLIRSCSVVWYGMAHPSVVLRPVMLCEVMLCYDMVRCDVML